MTEEAREHSFDELTRGLASGSLSRGKALRLMGAALVGGTLASLGIGEAAADVCKRNGKACKKNTQCCSGNCVNAPTGTCAACPSGSTLIGSTCCPNARVCGTGASLTCCPSDQECVGGVCQCPTGSTLCGGNCVSTTCSSGQKFDQSKCACVACTLNDGTCNANDQCCSGRCAGGMCAEPCLAGRVLLSNGTCAKTCAAHEDCAGCAFGCQQDVSGSRYCISGAGSGTACASDSNCPVPGEICINVPAPIGSPPSICAAAC